MTDAKSHVPIDPAQSASQERLEAAQRAAYEEYRQRWLQVPGDHAPGRLLSYAVWRSLAEELAQLTAQGVDAEPRGRQLYNALLIRRHDG